MLRLVLCLGSLLAFSSPLWAQLEALGWPDKLKQYIQNHQAMVYRVIADYATPHRVKCVQWRLPRNRTFRIYFAAEGQLDEYDLALQAPSRSWEAQRQACYGVAVDTWEVQTFTRPLTCKLRVLYIPPQAAKRARPFMVVVASVGRTASQVQSEQAQNPKRAVDSQGRVYEVRNGVVYCNGHKYYRRRRHTIVAVYVSKRDQVYLLDSKGAVLQQGTLVYRAKRHRVVKIAGNDDGKVFWLTHDNIVLNQDGYIVYKRKGRYQALALIEEGGQVWLLRGDGKRILLQ